MGSPSPTSRMTHDSSHADSRHPYTFKPEPFSSHSLLVACFPEQGSGLRVLDVGGGEGYLSAELAKRGFTVLCVAAPGSVARDFPEDIEVIEADLDLDPPPITDPFDYVLCGDVLEHLRRPEQTLRWVRSVLRPSGKLIASLPNSGHIWVRWNVLWGRFPKDERGLFDRTHLHFFTLAGWRELFASAGFRLESIEPTTTPVGLLLPKWRHSMPVRAAEWLAYATARLRGTLFAYQFVVVARP